MANVEWKKHTTNPPDKSAVKRDTEKKIYVFDWKYAWINEIDKTAIVTSLYLLNYVIFVVFHTAYFVKFVGNIAANGI